MLKTNKDSRVKLQTNIDLKLHHRFKTVCFLQGKGMNEVLTELIEAWLMANQRKSLTQTVDPGSKNKKESMS